MANQQIINNIVQSAAGEIFRRLGTLPLYIIDQFRFHLHRCFPVGMPNNDRGEITSHVIDSLREIFRYYEPVEIVIKYYPPPILTTLEITIHARQCDI